MIVYRFACDGPICGALGRWLASDPTPNRCPECDRLVEPVPYSNPNQKGEPTNAKA